MLAYVCCAKPGAIIAFERSGDDEATQATDPITIADRRTRRGGRNLGRPRVGERRAAAQAGSAFQNSESSLLPPARRQLLDTQTTQQTNSTERARLTQPFCLRVPIASRHTFHGPPLIGVAPSLWGL